MRTVSSLKSDLIRKLHGTSLSKLEGVYELIGEGGRNLIARIDPQETVRYTTIENALFDDVYSYTCPSDLKGDKIIDLGPQAGRTMSQNYHKTMIEEFTRKKDRKALNILYKNGTKFFRVNADGAPTKQVVSPVDATGGWSASSSATNARLDQLEYITGASSLAFDINTSTSTAIVENSTLNSLDLSTTDDLNSIFVWLYIPDSTKVTSVVVRYGSNSSNYYARTVTTSHDSAAFSNGWNLLRFDLVDGTETGTTDWSAMDYFRLTINHDQTGGSGYRIDSITVGVGKIYEVYYYSSSLFKGTDGTLKSVPTSDTDIILLEDDAYNILLYECSYVISQELQGENGSFDESFFGKKLNGVPGDPNQPGLYKQYAMSYPSQNKHARSTYYSMKAGNYRS